MAEGNDTAPFEEFASTLNGDELLKLLAQLTSLLIELNVPLDEDGHPRGLLSIWRLALKLPFEQKFDGDAARKALAQLIGTCPPEHLFLAEQLVHWFGENDEPKYEILPRQDARGLTQDLHEHLRISYGDAASTPEGQVKLLAALRGGREVTLLQAVWGIPAIRSKKHLHGLPFAGWESIRDSLLAAAAVAPEVVLGPLAWFVTAQDRESHDGLDRVVFMQDVAERLFGTQRLLDAYANASVTEFRSPQTRHAYTCVKLAVTDEKIRDGQQPYIIR